MVRKTHYVSHYHDDPNYRGRNPELITDLTKVQALRVYHKHLKNSERGDKVEMRKTTRSIW